MLQVPELLPNTCRTGNLKNLRCYLLLNGIFFPILNQFCSCSGLQQYLNALGFNIVGYGCTTCIGNSGDIDESVAAAITDNGNLLDILCSYNSYLIKYIIMTIFLFLVIPDIVAAAVLSGNRNFEGRVHPLTRANYLASPPLVVAYALAGTVS